MPSHRPLGPLSASTGTPLYQHTEAYGSSGSAAETAHRPAHAACCDRATRSPSHTVSRPEALTHTHTHTHTYVDPCRRAAITSHHDSSPHPHTPKHTANQIRISKRFSCKAVENPIHSQTKASVVKIRCHKVPGDADVHHRQFSSPGALRAAAQALMYRSAGSTQPALRAAAQRSLLSNKPPDSDSHGT